MRKFKIFIIGTATVAIAGAAYYGWHKNEAGSADGRTASAKAAAANSQNRPVTVVTVLAKKRDYTVRLSANGVVSAMSTVDIRPQITSTITKIHIKEGQFVRTGDLLFTLDSRTDELNLAKAQAQLDKDMATLADNQRQLARSKDLLDKKFISQSALDASLTLVQAQQAVLASDRAAVNAARVALSFNRIVAPSAGRTGLIGVYPGSLVQANATTAPLVTITQMDPITITFPLPQRNLPDALESMNNSKDSNSSFVMATLPDNKMQFKGKLQFVDNAVDAASGTVKVKAVFENKEMQLWPGAYVNVELGVQTLKDVIVVPQDAIIIGAKGKSLYIVDADGKAAMRPVTVTNSFGPDAVVTGIEAGAKVVLDGKQNLRPGTPVTEQGADGAGDKAGATSGQGGTKDAAAASAS